MNMNPKELLEKALAEKEQLYQSYAVQCPQGSETKIRAESKLEAVKEMQHLLAHIYR